MNKEKPAINLKKRIMTILFPNTKNQNRKLTKNYYE